MKSLAKFFSKPFVNVFLFSFFWALAIIISKSAFNSGAHPFTYLVQTSFISLLFLLAYVVPQKWTELKSLDKKSILIILGANAIHFGLGGFFSNTGTALTSAINVGFLGKFSLVTTLLFAWIFLKEKLTKSKIVAAIMLIIGAYLITTKGQKIIPQPGDVFIILACFSWSLGNVIIRKRLKAYPASGEIVALLRPMIGIPILFVVLTLAPLYPKTIQPTFATEITNFSYWPYLIVGSASSSLLSIFLNRTLKVASASYMTMMSMMTPIMTSIMAVLFLSEQFVSIQVVGALLIIGSGLATHYLKIDQD